MQVPSEKRKFFHVFVEFALEQGFVNANRPNFKFQMINVNVKFQMIPKALLTFEELYFLHILTSGN